MGSVILCRVFGIPIRAHFTLFLVLPLFAMRMSQSMGIPWIGGLACAIGLFASVALHELGHAWVSIRRGYGVRDIILTPIGGVALLKQSPRKADDEFWIAVAGPLVSATLAALLGLGGMTVMGWIGWRSGELACLILGAVNLSLFLFNLLPCFPMDGGRVYRAWMMKRVGRLEATRSAVRLGRWLSFALGFYGLFYGHFMLILIAIAVYWFAKMELRGVEMEEAPRRPPPWAYWSAGQPPFTQAQPREYTLDDQDVEVSPPPWERRP
ncbi:MAG: hypothetical protein H7A43_12580 [Verrucomicrobia bacterium]|nr:hypothetical protein [Kiritimatiellia bacterium]MCP5489470.1 hypothetical protein [Verrucomicrobiota bacterium]